MVEKSIEVKSEALTYWEFVRVARRRLGERFHDSEIESGKLALTLNRTSSLLCQVSESTILKKYKLNWSAFKTLFVLWNLESVNQSNLVELSGLGKATLSNLLRTLLEKGLIEKERSISDQRTFTICLTEEGNKLVEVLYLEQNEVFLQWASVLNDDERDTLTGILDKLLYRKDVFGISNAK